MYCRHCGKEIKTDSLFCTFCGGNLKEETSQKAGVNLFEASPKAKKKWILPAVIGAVVVLEAGGAATGYFIHSASNVKVAEGLTEQKEIGRDTDTNENQEPQENQGVLEVSAAVELENYLENELMVSMGSVDLKQEYYAAYEDAGDSFLRVGFVQGISGILTSDIRDYDKDGTEELFLLAVKEGMSENGLKYPEICFQMYEYSPEGVVLAAEEEVEYGAIGGTDEQTIALYRKEGGQTIYLAECGWTRACLIGDGEGEFLRVLHYEDQKFVIDMTREFRGSDFRGNVGEEVAKTAADLESLGFTQSAKQLDDHLELQNEDGMESFFVMHGENRDVYDFDSQLYAPEGYMVRYTGDPAGMGKVTYRFYPDQEEYLTQNGIQDYEVLRDDFSMAEGASKVTNYFDRIVFKGKNETNIKWLNRKIEDLEKEQILGADEVREYLQWMLGMGEAGSGELYNKNDICSVYMDEKGNVSVAYYQDWMMGGVHNDGYYAVNCNVLTKDMLTLEEVLGVDYETAQTMIRLAMWEQKGFDYDQGFGGYNAFYFDEDTVTVCLDCYFYGGNGEADTLILNRKNSRSE